MENRDLLFNFTVVRDNKAVLPAGVNFSLARLCGGGLQEEEGQGRGDDGDVPKQHMDDPM